LLALPCNVKLGGQLSKRTKQSSLLPDRVI
jgi:hypothetical protein